jgi:hypothetical protein
VLTDYVYCDESHINGPNSGFRIQGGIWVPDHGLRDVRAAFTDLRRRHPTITEMKWSYVTGKTPLTIYTDLITLFFHSPVSHLLSFKCLVVHRGEDPSRKLGKVGMDVGFYKAYFTFLKWRLAPGSTNHLRLDKKSSPRPSPEDDLAYCLNCARTPQRGDPFVVASCLAVSSKSEDLVQLADVLCGAVGWAWNGMQSTCGAKPILHQQIVTALGWPTLANRQTSGAATKFNVWRYRPR